MFIDSILIEVRMPFRCQFVIEVQGTLSLPIGANSYRLSGSDLKRLRKVKPLLFALDVSRKEHASESSSELAYDYNGNQIFRQ